MSVKKNQTTDNIVRCYEVTEPTLHPKGYTIYKVTERIIYIDAIEQNIKEAIVWRRFNDFRKLHKSLSSLHAALHRREEFPDFPKPQLFHRFEKSVVVERMRSAQDLLNFAGQRHYLVACKEFKEFFSGAEPVVTSPKEDLFLLPNKPYVDDQKSDKEMKKALGDGSGQLQPSAGDTQDSKQSSPQHEADGSRRGITSSQESLADDLSRTDLGEGFWCYRQVQEETSSGGHEFDDDDDNELGEDYSLPDILNGTPTCSGNALMDESELTFFDPLAGQLKGTGQLEPSNEQLLSMLTTNEEHCETVELKLEDNIHTDPIHDGATEYAACSSDDAENQELSLSSRYASDLADILGNSPAHDGSVATSRTAGSAIASTFPPHRGRSGSAVESGRGDLTVSPLHQFEEQKSSSSFNAERCQPSQSHAVSPKKSWTASISHFVSQDKSNYIVEAAEQISQAQKCEAAGAYHEAFSQYKCGVGTLLKGVQRDNDEKRREAVRRKISVYLRKAEKLYHQHLTNDSEQCDGNRWDLEHKAIFTELDSSVALLRGASAELGRFKVVGLISKVLLVVDTGTDGNFVIKVLHKNSVPLQSQKTIVPTHIPYMVSLVKFFETESAIYIVLQYAACGTLWNYVSGYFGQFLQDSGQELVADICGDLHEKQLRSAGRKGFSFGVQPKAAKDLCDRMSSKEKSNLDDAVTGTGNDSSYSGHLSNVLENSSCDDPSQLRDLHSESKSCEQGQHVNSTEDLIEQDNIESNQDFKTILENCVTDINSYSICSIDSDNRILSRLTSVNSDETEVTASEVDTHTSTFLPVSEDYSEITDNNEPCGNLKSQELCLSEAAVTDTTVPANLKSSEETSTVDSKRPMVAAKSRCRMNLPLSGSISRTKMLSEFVSPSDTGFREPLKSPSMSRLSSHGNDTSSDGCRRRRVRNLSSVFAELDLASDAPKDARHVTQLPEGCIRQWAAEMVVAISRLHCLGIICRDLHPCNILLGESGHILLTYFSQWNTVDLHISDDACDNIYCAPEILGVSEITPACDWWSLGAILYELFAGQSLRACHPAGITSHSSITLPSHVSEEACSLLAELLKFNPAERLGSGIGGSDDVRSHPFFAGIQWNHLLG